MSLQTLPEFASSGTVSVPNATKKSNGWTYLEKPAYQYMNWIHKTTYEYCAYIDQFFSNTDQFQIDEIIPLSGAVIDVTSISIHLNTTNFLVQKSNSDPATIQFVNSTTGATTGDGFFVGINASEQAVLQNIENTSMLFYTNNTSRMVIDNSGIVTISATTASTTKDTGCLVIEGGLGLEGNIYSGGAINSVLSGLMNKADSDTIYLQFANITTAATATDGFLVGIDASEFAILKNQENTGMLFYNNSAEVFRITADGKLSSGAEDAPDCDSGGLTLQQKAGDGKILTFKSTDSNHGITDEAETDTFGFIKKNGDTTGGLNISCFTSSSGAWQIIGTVTTTNTDISTDVFPIQIIAYKKSGTGTGNFNSNENIFRLKAKDYNLIKVGMDKIVFCGYSDNKIKLSTGGEYAPDCSDGGLTLQQNSEDGIILSFKSTDVAHGVTDIAETDTYGYFKKYSATNGGVFFSTLTEDITSYYTYIIATNTNTASNASASAAIYFDIWKKNGTNITGMAADDNIVLFATGSVPKHIFKGDGDIYIDGAVTAFDDQNDIMLSNAARYSLAGIDNHITGKYKNELQKLGIISDGGFVSTKKMMSLHLGTFGQMFNIIKHLAKKLNISESELFEMAKDYSI